MITNKETLRKYNNFINFFISDEILYFLFFLHKKVSYLKITIREYKSIQNYIVLNLTVFFLFMMIK